MDALEFRRAAPAHRRALGDLFTALLDQGDHQFFHPHPFTAEEAMRIVTHPGRDLYLLALRGDKALAYGLLRGWDEGYAVPSLGIALHPDARGTGLSRAFMGFMHAAARLRGAPRVRLKVYPDNVPARRLYESLGYVFTDRASDGQLVGVLELLTTTERAIAG